MLLSDLKFQHASGGAINDLYVEWRPWYIRFLDDLTSAKSEQVYIVFPNLMKQ